MSDAMTQAPLHVETPLVQDEILSERLQRPVWLKLESRQPSGSFKLRGIGLAMQRRAEAGVEGFVSSSGGNAGLATAYAGAKLGLPVTVVVPEGADAGVIARMEAHNALVVRHGEDWEAAHEEAVARAERYERALIHPFDDDDLWEGHASLIEELVEAEQPFADIVLSVGGGGLFAGVVRGLVRTGLANRTTVHAVETRGAASFARALREGKPTRLESLDTKATSLAAREVCFEAVLATSQVATRSWILGDDAAARGVAHLAETQGEAVELACGAALALPFAHQRALRPSEDAVIFIVCGGVVGLPV